MMQTNGGATLERVAGFDYYRAQNRGLPFFPATSLPGDTPPPGIDRPENTIGAFDLTPIQDTTLLPWRSIAFLNIRYARGGSATGTAWFIGPRTLATAGHNVYHHHVSGGDAIEIYVSPGFDGVRAPYGTEVAMQAYAPPQWRNHGAPEFDYGVLTLPDDRFGPKLGWFGFAEYQSPPDDMLAQISGYAEVRNAARTQYYQGGRLANWSPNFIEYTFDTELGMSGAPVFLKSDNNRIAIGIHTYGGNVHNKGRRIIGSVYDALLTFSTYDP